MHKHKNAIGESWGIAIPSFLGDHHVDSQCHCPSVQSHQQLRSVPLVSNPHQCELSLVLLILAIWLVWDGISKLLLFTLLWYPRMLNIKVFFSHFRFIHREFSSKICTTFLIGLVCWSLVSWAFFKKYILDINPLSDM